MDIAPVPAQVARVWAETAEGRGLLADLPTVLAELSERFGVAEIGTPFGGGWVGYVVPATLRDGRRAVLKVSLSDEEHAHEADALERWAGDGAVQLLDRVGEPNAMLLERCEPGTPLLAHADRDAAIAIACSLLRRLERPLVDGHPFLPVPELARRYATSIPSDFARLGRAFDPALADEAAALCAVFARDTAPPYLVNRDFHLGNVLAARREPWLAIDPKPMSGDPHYEPAPMLWNRFDEYGDEVRDGVRRRFHTLVDAAGLDEARARDWVVVRMVINAHWAVEDAERARRPLDADERIWITRCIAITKAVQD
jgi:streptomycin 6-kinase